MKPIFAFALAAALPTILLDPALAQQRYHERPPLVVSPDLSAPWVLQLQRAPSGLPRGTRRIESMPGMAVRVAPAPMTANRPRVPAEGYGTDAITTSAAPGAARSARPSMDERYLPQTVAYDGPHKAGTIVIDTNNNFLFHVQADGTARRYGVGTGKPGFEWAGTHKVTRKAEWPDWRPPAEMIAREKRKGRILPAHMRGGPENPLGARALYLGSTLYRIHGTNQPWTIGQAVSSGCIRMRNEDVIELYENVTVGTKVVVI